MIRQALKTVEFAKHNFASSVILFFFFNSENISEKVKFELAEQQQQQQFILKKIQSSIQ